MFGRAAAAVTRHRQIDQIGVERMQRLFVEPKLGHDPRAEVLEQNMKVRHQPGKGCLASLGLQVKCQ